MKSTKDSGCGTILIVLAVIGFISTYWPFLLGIFAIVVIFYGLFKWTLLKTERIKEQKEGQNISTEACENENFIEGTVLTSGKYIGGRDLDIGIYNLSVISGNGYVETDIPDNFQRYFSYDVDNSYNNLEIAKGTVLRIGSGIKIRLHDKRKYEKEELVMIQKDKNGNKRINLDNMDGHDFEYFCAKVLRENGYQNVCVTRGSGDQGVDVLAERDGIKYAIQCKNYSQPVGNKAVQEIYTGMRFYRCHVGIVMTNNSFTASAVELAKENGIILWGRDYLIKFIDKNEDDKIGKTNVE